MISFNYWLEPMKSPEKRRTKFKRMIKFILKYKERV